MLLWTSCVGRLRACALLIVVLPLVFLDMQSRQTFIEFRVSWSSSGVSLAAGDGMHTTTTGGHCRAKDIGCLVGSCTE